MLYQISICCQILLIWVAINKYGLDEIVEYLKPTSTAFGAKGILFFTILCVSFFISLIFLFRGIIIVQQSYSNYGLFKNDLYNDAIFAAIIGTLALIIFVILFITGNRFFKKNSLKVTVPILIIGISLVMLNTHISHNF